MKKIILIMMLLVPVACFGAPGKPSVSGGIAPGETVTISVSGFGSTVFDNFRAGDGTGE